MKHMRKCTMVLVFVLLMSFLVSTASAAVVNVKSYSSSFTAGSKTATFSQGTSTANLTDYNCGYYATLRIAAGYKAGVTIIMSCQEKQSDGTFVSKSTSSFSNTFDNTSSTTVKVVPANSNKVAVVCNSADMDVVKGKQYRYRLAVTAPTSCSGRYWGIMSSTNNIHGTQVDMP